jgi:RNA polymerase sigma factor (TIGR02999 family)
VSKVTTSTESIATNFQEAQEIFFCEKVLESLASLPDDASMPENVTRLLNAIDAGGTNAADELLPLVYEELRRLAAIRMAKEKSGQTLQATALVHEAWLQLAGDQSASWNSRNHFFKAASESMRRILIANARRKKREKHGGHIERIPLDKVEVAADADPETLLMVAEALEKLESIDPVKGELVKLRFMAGFSNAEAAEILGVSVPTVKRYWAFARAWMYEEIEKMKSSHQG